MTYVTKYIATHLSKGDRGHHRPEQPPGVIERGRDDSTTTSLPVISPRTRQQAATWLLADAQQRVADPLTSPALDCGDLDEQMPTNADAAYADLARLDLVQLTMQAVCYAAYANELLGLELRGDDVLAFWAVALARRGMAQ